MIEQRERLYQLDKPSLTRDAARPASTQNSILSPGWIGLERCNVSPIISEVLEVPHVLLHPDVGVALVDLAPAVTPNAEAAFRARLEAARFAAIFPGQLPVVHLQLRPEELGQLAPLMSNAFAGLQPISLPGGDGWVSVVRRALAQRAPARRLPDRAADIVGPSMGPDQDTATPRLNREVAAEWAGLAARVPLLGLAPPSGLSLRLPLIPIGLGLAGLLGVATAAAVLWSGPQEPQATASAPERTSAAPLPTVAATDGPPPTALSESRPQDLAAPVPRDRAVPPPRAPEPMRAAAPAPPPPAPPSAADPGMQLAVRAAANLRARPDNTAPILRVAPKGEVLREFGRTPDGWVSVGDVQPRGWIFSTLLVPAKP